MSRQTKFLIVFICVIPFILYGLTIRARIGNFDTTLSRMHSVAYGTPFESPHERSSYLLLNSFALQHTTILKPSDASFGQVDIGTYNGKIYSLFPIGVPLVATPFFLLGRLINLGQLSAYIPTVLFAMLSIYLIFLITKNILGLSVYASLFAGFLFAFAAPSWSYAITFYQHLPSTFLMLASLYTAFLFSKNNRYHWLILSCFFYSVSWTFDYQNLLMFAPIPLVLLSNIYLDRKHTSQKTILTNLSILFGFLFCAVLSVLVYNHIVFGHWYIISNNLPHYNTSITQVITYQRLKLTRTFSLGYVFNGLYILLLEEYRGLLFFAPLFIVSILGIRLWWKKRERFSIALLGLGFVTIFFYSTFLYADGGWAFGPRYIIPAMAALSPFIAYWLEKSKLKARSIIAFLGIVYGTAVALLGALTTNMIPDITHASENYGDFTFNRMYSFLFSDRSPSFLYNTAFSWMPLWIYYLMIFLPLIGIFTYLILKITRNKVSFDTFI